MQTTHKAVSEDANACGCGGGACQQAGRSGDEHRPLPLQVLDVEGASYVRVRQRRLLTRGLEDVALYESNPPHPLYQFTPSVESLHAWDAGGDPAWVVIPVNR